VAEQRAAAAAKDVVIDCSGPGTTAGADLVVQADPTMLAQILRDLLGNAVKFSPPAATVYIRTDVSEGAVVMRVSDFGKGIPRNLHPFIFDSFRQVDAGFTREHGGTGLGLAIAKRLVELHQGEIEVESQPGKGCTFIVRLPRNGPSQQTTPGPHEAFPGPKR
jgi:signal transduction histidine kinase